ncbi:hypothetical protein Slin15195_G112240 [Septoria linicola]|uniref:F-box domain-containing protein n=1 Tax=Septoria linicola TaxID=215465 RepID=A0A9Q9AZE1_9PEZI|nr:hypothetical protein Slin14017_G110600 [Septoria linicola]USW57905.1 hypothetical protein Slin15195_G112240 [Septoria linicola]
MGTMSRKRMMRRDSLTGIEKYGDAGDDCASSDEVDSFEDAQEMLPTPADRVLQTAELLDRILSLMASRSNLKTTLALSRAGQVNRTWHATVKRNKRLQRLMWFMPGDGPTKSTFGSSDKIFVRFNPMLWPIQPSKCTLSFTHHELNTGSRGPASWRKMLVASASHDKFAITVAVDGVQVAMVWCTAAMTVGMLLDKARKLAGQSGDFRRCDE